MSETTKTPDITLIGIASGSFPASDPEARALAAEVLRLREAVRAFLAAYDAEETDDYDYDAIDRAMDEARMGLRRVLGGGR